MGPDPSDRMLWVFFFFFFFFLAFAGYTIKAAREMNDVVFSSSCLQPQSLVIREGLTGHTSSLVAL